MRYSAASSYILWRSSIFRSFGFWTHWQGILKAITTVLFQFSLLLQQTTLSYWWYFLLATALQIIHWKQDLPTTQKVKLLHHAGVFPPPPLRVYIFSNTCMQHLKIKTTVKTSLLITLMVFILLTLSKHFSLFSQVCFLACRQG